MVIELTENRKPCIWMEAGVIDYKTCDKDFDCEHCELDRALTEAATANLARLKARQKAEELGRELPWEDKMRRRFGEKQKCRLMMTKFCHECSFDELLEEQFDFFLAPERPRVEEVFGITVPTSSFLHRGHTWVALENAGRVRLGVDDFSQRVFGPADRLRLPEAGEELHADRVALTLSRQGKSADVLAPLSGTINVVNPKVLKNPHLAHDDPCGDGWLFVVSPYNLKTDLEKMLFGQCNLAWIEHESHRLLGMLESVSGVTLPSGGAILDDVFNAYPQLGWERLVREFLHSA